jgi:hypothetical protein
MTTEPYDSRPDTLAHIETVRQFLGDVIHDLQHRATIHDRSKLREPEVSVLDRVTPQLADLEYGSPEYRAALDSMGPALDHHYANNDHHPEHHPGGIADMDLGQMTEMLADWKAGTLRNRDGDLTASIRLNAKRFGYGPDIERLLLNTARRYGWL